MSEKYQGWKNYPTWCVALWIDNDEGLYDHALELAGYWADSRDDIALISIADELKDWIEEMAPELEASMYSDLLSWAIEQVEWRELATHYLQTARENRE